MPFPHSLILTFLIMFNPQIAKADIEIERETYQTSRSGLNEMYTEAKEKLQEETQAREVSDKSVPVQICALGVSH